jgi:hypothetical protein
MGRLSNHARRMRAGIALALLAAVVAAPTAARADKGKGGGDQKEDKFSNAGGDEDHGPGSLNCPGRETLVSVEELTCPPNKNRPLIVRKRACCKNPAGRVHCDHFPHCPNESPS